MSVLYCRVTNESTWSPGSAAEYQWTQISPVRQWVLTDGSSISGQKPGTNGHRSQHGFPYILMSRAVNVLQAPVLFPFQKGKALCSTHFYRLPITMCAKEFWAVEGPSSLSSIHENHGEEGENWLLQAVFSSPLSTSGVQHTLHKC